MSEPPAGPAGGFWVAHTSPDGRPFWNHTVTKQSVWEKPSELKTAVELEMEKTSWTEYVTGGRKYWVHKETKETTWEMPQILREILARAAQQPQSASPAPGSTPTFVAGGNAPLNASTGALVGPGGFSPASGLPNKPLGNALPQAPMVVDFQTEAEAQEAFMHMLEEKGVNTDWTWERTMTEIITHPLYKALKTLADRKAAFEKHIQKLKDIERSAREESLARWRKDFHKVLDKLGGGTDKDDGVKSWWSTPRALYEAKRRMPAEIWSGLRNDEERRTLVDEFLASLRTKQATRKKELREKNIEKATRLLIGLQFDLAGTLKWRDVRDAIFNSPEWQHDRDLQQIDPIDLLTVYEEELKKAEREAQEAKQHASEAKRRRGRKAREDFSAVLQELKENGDLRAGASWTTIYPRVANDERYDNLLGISGSTPLDLFWDTVDELDALIRDDLRIVENLLDQRRDLKVEEDTTFEKFANDLQGEDRLRDVAQDAIRAAYDKLHARAVSRAREDRRREEKHLRLQIDDLRYAFKKLDPPVDLDSTYEENVDRVKDTPEYQALTDDQSRRLAFEKFVRRQKDKLKERGYSDNESVEKRGSRRDRDQDRNRERDRIREPERDADYERDRDASKSKLHRSSHRHSRRDRVHNETEDRPKREASEDIHSGVSHKMPRLERQSNGATADGLHHARPARDEEEVEEGEI